MFLTPEKAFTAFLQGKPSDFSFVLQDSLGLYELAKGIWKFEPFKSWNVLQTSFPLFLFMSRQWAIVVNIVKKKKKKDTSKPLGLIMLRKLKSGSRVQFVAKLKG